MLHEISMTHTSYHNLHEPTNMGLMKKLYKLVTALIIGVSLFLCWQIIVQARSAQIDKIELAELNHMRYGLLSVDVWKDQLAIIVTEEINKLDIRPHEKALKQTLEVQLGVLIDKINARIQESNKGTASGFLKQAFMNVFVSIEDIKKGIPTYADAMLAEMKKPRAQRQLKSMLKTKVDGYINETFDMQDMTQVNRILFRTNALNVEDAKLILAKEIDTKYGIVRTQSIILVILIVILFAIPYFIKKPLEPFQYFSLVIALLILLAAGVTIPMIDMEAKISKMTFMLMDHPINFENQVLFYQSKGVLDVFWIMITDSSVLMQFVGILMVCFSIVFPLIKLTTSVAYYYDFRGSRSKKWVEFFVLKSGKWSMADVLVIAIFMSYIGFNGVITSQFGKLKNATPDLVIFTTNGTSLQPGYFLFLGYAILAMVLSGMLMRRADYAEKIHQSNVH